MKVHLLYRWKASPAGGGNQFLRAFDSFLARNGVRADHLYDADVVLFNSHQYIKHVARLKRKFSEKVFVHRIDGIFKLYNSPRDKRDEITNMANLYIADGSIFQSKWSKDTNHHMGMKENKFEIIIPNAPDESIFNRLYKRNPRQRDKKRFIASSMSVNWNKGFETYKWLDDNLDFKKYEMVFVGNSPVKFKNIHQLEPLTSEELALELKKSDIYITASRKDTCSNSLIEALHCGLPAVGLKDGGNPELIGKAGELFETAEEIPELLKKILDRYSDYINEIKLPTMEEVGSQYYDFMNDIFEQRKRGYYRQKILGLKGLFYVYSAIARWQLSVFSHTLVKRIRPS